MQIDKVLGSTVNQVIDEMENEMRNHEPIVSPVKHFFCGGFYIRQVFMPKGEGDKKHVITSMVHNTMHPYFVSEGKVLVGSENDGFQRIEAPCWGITMPNTRRVLEIVESTVWTTFHRTDIVPENDSEEAKEAAALLVGNEILAKYENEVMGGHSVNNNFIPILEKLSELY